MDNGGTGAIGTADRFLSTAAVVALALSQPLLDLLGRTPTFFVARGAPVSDAVLVGLLVGIAVPLWFAAVVALVGRVNDRAGNWLHSLVLAVSGALLAVAVSKAIPTLTLPGWLLVVVAAVAGFSTVVAYHRWTGLRAALRFAGAAPLVVAGWFLLATPVARLIAGPGLEATPVDPVAGGVPVVMVVFDEFPLATLIDSDGNISSELFPGFARLAADGTWFRNAVGVHDNTAQALPAILSGVTEAPPGAVPTSADHPDTLFTLLADGYQVQAVESVTALCPPGVCVGGTRPHLPARQRWQSLVSDLSVIAGHVLLPTDLTGWLPGVDRGWGDFASAGDTGNFGLARNFGRELATDRGRILDEFLGRLDHPPTIAEFHFAHVLLPHSPWEYLPDGRRHGAPPIPPGEAAVLSDDAWLVAQSYQRHLLQARHVDGFLADLVGTLESHGSYHDTLIVVVADHGVAIRPGMERRSVNGSNVGDMAAIPLFVKPPGPPRGGVSDYRAETVDVLPTVAGVLGVEVPWATDGVDLFAPVLPPRTSSTMLGDGGPVTFGVSGEEKLEVARYHEQWFGGGGPFDLALPGYRDLLGTEVRAFPSAPATGAEVIVDQDYPPADPDTDLIPAYMSGTLEGAPVADHVLAIALDGVIVAVTRTWDDSGATRFQAMLPPDALDSTSTPTLYLVGGTGTDRALEHLGE